VVIGAGRPAITKALGALGQDVESLAQRGRYALGSRVEDLAADARRVLVLHETATSISGRR